MSKETRVLVTGATGFIGARIASFLTEDASCRVRVLGRKPSTALNDLVQRGCEFIAGDLTDEGYVGRVTKDVQAVIHCAGLAGTWGPYEDYYRANVLATENLLKAAKAHGVRRFVNISSPSVYFDYKDQLNLKENDLPEKFSNAYAQTKYESEKWVQEFHSQGFETVSLRPRSVIGAGDQNILPRLIRLHREGRLFQIGDGQNVVDITTIGNLIHAVDLCLKAPGSALGRTYNVTNGEPILFWEFVENVLQTAHLKWKKKRLPYAPVMAFAVANEKISRWLGRENEPAILPITVGILSFSMTMDISAARSQLGYNPSYTTQDGIDEFFKSISGAEPARAARPE